MAKNILIIDDDEDDRDLLCDAIQQIDSSCNCVKVNNGEEALRLLWSGKGYRPDFIFLDINMPVINGKKCLSEIMKSRELDHIPVIIYTTSKRVEDKEETIRMGAVYFITKPSSLIELCNEITFVLENKWQISHGTSFSRSENSSF